MDLVHPSSKFPLPLPEDIICHILCLLPVKTLVALRCVSRQWCSLIDSPYFVKLHIECSITTSSNLTLIFHTSVDKYVRNVWDDYFSHDGENIPDGGLYSLDFVNFESESDSDSESEFTCTALHPLDDNPMKNVVEDASLTQVIASCNGLLLLAERRTGYVFILWNPCTGKYHKIPELPLTDRLYFNNSRFCDDVYGFGYDLINQDYKLVWIVTKFMLNTERQQVYVYSLNSDSWRRVLDLFRYDIGFNATHAVLVNNTLHWTGYPPASPNWDEYPDYVIVAFDLVAEECHELPHPNDVDLHCFHTVLSVFEGCLSLISVPNRVIGMSLMPMCGR
ncbi:F-box protein [Quillaja saponaria]|uniref:F-box protein n=1 Tax=Quillaja saponaria TaxID=32244 RepID=A0AAD7LMS5_QUISA|nr:F-box protein [Quillaja saponaria]